MDATNGGILGGVLLLVLVFFVIFFIHIKRAQGKKSREKNVFAPTVQEVAVIEPVPITNLIQLNHSVWDDDAEYQTSTFDQENILEHQNTLKEKQKLNLSLRQEAIIKEQSKIFHETYSKVLAEKQRAKDVQSVIEDQKKIYNEIKQNAVLTDRGTHRTEDEQYVIEEQNKIYNKIKQNSSLGGKQPIRNVLVQSVTEDQSNIYKEVEQNRVDSIRRQFEQRPFDYTSTSTQSTTANVNMFQPASLPHHPEYYKQPSYNPNYY